MVQRALRKVLEPIFEREFAEHSYGFRPHRGCKDALRRVEELLKAGYTSVVDADLKSYFDTIPHDRLLALVAKQVSDGRMLELIEGYLKQGVLDGLREWTPDDGHPPRGGDQSAAGQHLSEPAGPPDGPAGYEMVRYADDFVILCRSPAEAARALAKVQQWTAGAGLTLHPTKTRIVDAKEDGFDFLGYRFEGGTRRPREKSLDKFKDTIRAKTQRTSGDESATDHRRPESDPARLV